MDDDRSHESFVCLLWTSSRMLSDHGRKGAPRLVPRWFLATGHGYDDASDTAAMKSSIAVMSHI